MDLNLNSDLAISYKSNSQKIRIITESWVEHEVYCPSCGRNLKRYEANRPLADFYCDKCEEDYELKSKKEPLTLRITDGEYHKKIERLKSLKNPHFFFLTYNRNIIHNFMIIPKHYFIPGIIEKRKPLSRTARRAGWIGSNIILTGIPESGRIFYIKNKIIQDKNKVITSFTKTIFLKDTKIENKGWLFDVMRCVEKLKKNRFLLSDIYAFEKELSNLHPENKHIKPKIRQQLQYLRDKGYLFFEGKGRYRIE